MAISLASPRSLRGLAVPLRAVVRTTLAAEKRRPGEISFLLTDDARLRELNRRYRGIDRATDVLSFGGDTAPPGKAVGGDLAISLDRMAEQARRFRVTPGRELARLIIHGTLHLAGLDHHRPAERRHMREQEERALRACRAHVRRIDQILARSV